MTEDHEPIPNPFKNPTFLHQWMQKTCSHRCGAPRRGSAYEDIEEDYLRPDRSAI